MSMWVRGGPFSVSSRGRMGVRAGPVSFYGGGRSGGGTTIFAWLMFLMVVAIIFWFVVMLPLSLFGHAIGLTPSWHDLNHQGHAWMHKHYPLVGLRYIGTAVLMLMGVIGMRSEHKKRVVKRRQQPVAGTDVACDEARVLVVSDSPPGTPAELPVAPPEVSVVPPRGSSVAPPAGSPMPERFTQEWLAQNTSCPECGSEVSNKAPARPKRGVPLASAPREVLIHVDRSPGHLFNIGCSVSSGGKVVANGKQGDTLRVPCTQPMEIEVKVNGWFGKPKLVVQPGERYNANPGIVRFHLERSITS